MFCFVFQAEDGIRDLVRSRGLGDVYKRQVYIFSPEGNLLQKIETPGSKPTNLEFGDEDYQTLYLTEVETNSLYKIRTKHPGKNILIK